MSRSFRRKSATTNSRRAFLRALGSGAAAALLAACNPRRPGPTPTPTRTPRPTHPALAATPEIAVDPSDTRLLLPIVTNNSPSPLATPTIPPTDTPQPVQSPTPNVTDTPRATPTPTATPFPPGPPSKLGLFITRNDPNIRDLLDTGNVTLIKTLEYDPNFVQELRQRAPNAVLIGRMNLTQMDIGSMTDPKGAAQAFVDRLLPIATEARRKAAFDAWEAYNEPVVGDNAQMARLAEFEAERVRLLAAAGIRSVIGNFASGTPPLELWPAFRPAIEAAMQAKGYLGLHEYAAPTMQFGTPQDPTGLQVDANQEGWLTLRYRKVYRQFLQPANLNIPILLTEVGVDGAVTNRPGPQGKGWRDFANYWMQDLHLRSNPAGDYMEQLAWYDAHLQQDKYILGAAIFAAGASPGWESFEILDEVRPFLRQYLSVHPPH